MYENVEEKPVIPAKCDLGILQKSNMRYVGEKRRLHIPSLTP